MVSLQCGLLKINSDRFVPYNFENEIFYRYCNILFIDIFYRYCNIFSEKRLKNHKILDYYNE